jgi:hypothetical protein
MWEKIKTIVNNNLNFTIKVLIVLFVIYWFFYFTTPKTTMSDEDKNKVDSLLTRIELLMENQKKLDASILKFEGDIKIINDSIVKIKKEKLVIREIYYEEINRVRNFDDRQLDSFFTARYGYYPNQMLPERNIKADSRRLD